MKFALKFLPIPITYYCLTPTQYKVVRPIVWKVCYYDHANFFLNIKSPKQFRNFSRTALALNGIAVHSTLNSGLGLGLNMKCISDVRGQIQ